MLWCDRLAGGFYELDAKLMAILPHYVRLDDNFHL
jgi:hypothetical protein